MDTINGRVSTKEVARLLGISPNTVQKHAKNGSLSGTKIRGRWTFFRPTIETILDQGNNTDRLISLKEAAEHLNETKSRVKSWISQDYLKANKLGSRWSLNLLHVKEFKNRITGRKAINDIVKEAYSCWICGVQPEAIAKYANIEEYELQKGIEQYMLERKRYLKNLQIPGEDVQNHYELLTYTEVAARLKVVKWRIARDLVEKNKLKYKEFRTNKGKKQFITADSLIDFLGDHSESILFKSEDVSKIINMSAYWIDRRSKYHNIGMKLKDTKQGIRLYGQNDIEQLRKLSNEVNRNN